MFPLELQAAATDLDRASGVDFGAVGKELLLVELSSGR